MSTVYCCLTLASRILLPAHVGETLGFVRSATYNQGSVAPACLSSQMPYTEAKCRAIDDKCGDCSSENPSSLLGSVASGTDSSSCCCTTVKSVPQPVPPDGAGIKHSRTTCCTLLFSALLWPFTVTLQLFSIADHSNDSSFAVYFISLQMMKRALLLELL